MSSTKCRPVETAKTSGRRRAGRARCGSRGALQLARRLGQATTGAWTALGGLPRQFQAVLHRAASGRIDVQLVHRNLELFVREMDRSSNRLSFAVVIGALIVGSSVVLQSGRGVPGSGSFWLGLAGFVIAGVLGIGLAVGIVRSGRL